MHLELEEPIETVVSEKALDQIDRLPVDGEADMLNLPIVFISAKTVLKE